VTSPRHCAGSHTLTNVLLGVLGGTILLAICVGAGLGFRCQRRNNRKFSSLNKVVRDLLPKYVESPAAARRTARMPQGSDEPAPPSTDVSSGDRMLPDAMLYVNSAYRAEGVEGGVKQGVEDVLARRGGSAEGGRWGGRQSAGGRSSGGAYEVRPMSVRSEEDFDRGLSARGLAEDVSGATQTAGGSGQSYTVLLPGAPLSARGPPPVSVRPVIGDSSSTVASTGGPDSSSSRDIDEIVGWRCGLKERDFQDGASDEFLTPRTVSASPSTDVSPRGGAAAGMRTGIEASLEPAAGLYGDVGDGSLPESTSQLLETTDFTLKLQY
jgi:hypothetical protein